MRMKTDENPSQRRSAMFAGTPLDPPSFGVLPSGIGLGYWARAALGGVLTQQVDGNDYLDGGAGADWMEGGRDDTLFRRGNLIEAPTSIRSGDCRDGNCGNCRRKMGLRKRTSRILDSVPTSSAINEQFAEAA